MVVGPAALACALVVVVGAQGDLLAEALLRIQASCEELASLHAGVSSIHQSLASESGLQALHSTSDGGGSTWASAEAVHAACRHLGSARPPQKDSVVVDVPRATNFIGRASNFLSAPSQANLPWPSDLDEWDFHGRGLQAEDFDPPWYIDTTSVAYPLFQCLVVICIFWLVVFLWEKFVLGTTLLQDDAGSLKVIKDAEEAAMKLGAHIVQTPAKTWGSLSTALERMKQERQTGYVPVQAQKEKEPQSALGAVSAPAPAKAAQGQEAKPEGGQASPRKGAEDAKANAVEDVGFALPMCPSREADGHAVIVLQRWGSVAAEKEVKVVTRKDEHASQLAEPSTDYVHTEAIVRFEPDQQFAKFTVPLLQTNGAWQPSRYFLVEMIDSKAAPGTSVQARVVILQQDTFPGNIPCELAENHGWLMWYYIKDRMRASGELYWKTLFGAFYNPIHSAVVRPVVIYLMLDWATQWDTHGSSCYLYIVIVCCMFFASMLADRAADVIYRTSMRPGGPRMQGRKDLTAKFLSLDDQEQWETTKRHWIADGITNSEQMVNDGYIVSFLVCRAAFGMVLSLVVIFVTAIYGAARNGGTFGWEKHITPAALAFLLIPISLVWLVNRNMQNSDKFQSCNDANSAWFAQFVSIMSSPPAGVTVEEKAILMTRFNAVSGVFLKWSGFMARRIIDSYFLSTWIGYTAFIVVLMWASNKLLYARAVDSSSFSDGDFTFILMVFWSFRGNLSGMNIHFVNFNRAAVAVQRIAMLLNLPEHQHLVRLLHMQREDFVGFCKVCQYGSISLRGVQFATSESFRAAGMAPEASIEIPLHDIVQVASGSDEAQATFMALVAKFVHPSRGEVVSAPSQWALYLTERPIWAPNVTVFEVLTFAGAQEDTVKQFCQLLQLPLEANPQYLPLGDAQLVNLARATFRDPPVIVMCRALSLVARDRRRTAQKLLFGWQQTGVNGLLAVLKEEAGRLDQRSPQHSPRAIAPTIKDAPSSPEKPAAPESPKNVNHRARRMTRTLVAAWEDLYDAPPQSGTVVINLDGTFDPQ